MLHAHEVAAARQVAGSYPCLIWERPLVAIRSNTGEGGFPTLQVLRWFKPEDTEENEDGGGRSGTY